MKSILGKRKDGSTYISKKKFKSTVDNIKKAYTRSKSLQIQLGIEKKYKDSSFTGTLSTTPGGASGMMDPATALCLNGISVGNSPQEREGRNYVVDSVFVNGYVQLSLLSGSVVRNTPTYYIALVQDTQTNSGQMTSDLCFTQSSSSIDQATQLFRNLSNSKRFKVLWSQHGKFDIPTIFTDGTGIDSMGTRIPFYAAVPKLQAKVNCNTTGTDGTISVITDNSFHMVGWSDNTNMPVVLTYNSRVRFMG